MENAGSLRMLSSQNPHDPARREHAAHKHGEAVQPVANLFPGSAALGDAKDYRGKDRKQQGGGEM
jgi:hypothetical protein